MDDMNRRDALQKSVGLGLMAALTPAPGDEPAKPAKTDRDFVMAAGMTEAEAECWAATAKAAGLFFELPELHPMDKQEVASAIHVLQNKLLSRPTYRKYLETAKASLKAK